VCERGKKKLSSGKRKEETFQKVESGIKERGKLKVELESRKKKVESGK
jgi:hypothetical protein